MIFNQMIVKQTYCMWERRQAVQMDWPVFRSFALGAGQAILTPCKKCAKPFDVTDFVESPPELCQRCDLAEAG